MSLLGRWLQRARARARLRHEVGFWYHPGYAHTSIALSARTVGFDVQRVEKVITALTGLGLLRASDLRKAYPAAYAKLLRAHTEAYLADTARRETVAHIFGMDPAGLDPDPLLRAQRLAVGGTVAAARAVARGELRVAMNLGGGFHHAEPGMGSGFCIYNDVAVAIRALRADGFSEPIAIVDLDYHQGNGNLQTFASDVTVLKYSIQGSTWVRLEAVSSEEIELPPGTGDREYLDTLRATLPQALRRHRPGIVFYIAGNDVLAGDKLGDFKLSPDGVLERDVYVVQAACEANAGLVVTLGGGYSPQAWRSSASFAAALLAGERVPELLTLPESDDLRARFARIARELDPASLRGAESGADWRFTEEDLYGDLQSSSGPRRFLGFYGLHGIEYALERYGLFAKLREKGFSEVTVTGDWKDRDHEVLRVHGVRGGSKHLLVELVAHEQRLPAPDGGEALRMLSVEWLLLQDPSSKFTLERPPLPGQQFPGLGLADEVREILVQTCIRLRFDGIASHPAHFHNARVASRWFVFLDPAEERRFRELMAVYEGYDLSEVSNRLDEEKRWNPGYQVLPVSDRLRMLVGQVDPQEPKTPAVIAGGA